MPNFLAIHKGSSLILEPVTSAEQPAECYTYRFIRASEVVLNKYYKLLGKKRDGTNVSAGELAVVSPAFREPLTSTRRR